MVAVIDSNIKIKVDQIRRFGGAALDKDKRVYRNKKGRPIWRIDCPRRDGFVGFQTTCKKCQFFKGNGSDYIVCKKD